MIYLIFSIKKGKNKIINKISKKLKNSKNIDKNKLDFK